MTCEFKIEDFERGMRVKVIDDVLTLERLCKVYYGWNDMKPKIAGQWYDVLQINKDPPTLILSSGNWYVPVEAVERTGQKSQRKPRR